MVRRWSCVNNFNFFFQYNSFLVTRFKIFKLLKAVNYKKFNYGISKFNRHKLATWRRRSTWLIYSNVFKFWIRDYNFFKRLVKSQFVDGLFINSLVVYNFDYVKKKNPLRYDSFNPHLSYSISKVFLLYFYKKYINNSSLLFLSRLKNNNFTAISSPVSPAALLSYSSERILPLMIKSENEFFSTHIFSKKNLFFNLFFYHLQLRQILYTYKIFIFLIYFNMR